MRGFSWLVQSGSEAKFLPSQDGESYFNGFLPSKLIDASFRWNKQVCQLSTPSEIEQPFSCLNI